MNNLWIIIKEWYELLHLDKINEAEDKFKVIYTYFGDWKIKKWDDDFNKVTSCILGLGEINMKRGNIKEGLQFYLEWNQLTDWKDFNILFNLWVVYKNLGEDNLSNDYLDKARIINPNDANIIIFLWEMSDNTNKDLEIKFDKSFEDKIIKMKKNINFKDFS